MKRTAYLLLMMGLFFQTAAKCQEDWSLKKDKNGIKVYSRKTTNYKFNELKVEAVFDGRISQLAAVLLNVDKQYEWVYKTIKSEMVKKNSATDVIYYSEIEVPWPFDNRDLVMHMNIQQNLQNKALSIVVKSENEQVPVKNNIARIKYALAKWTVTPINTAQFKIEYSIQVDPGDGIPAWLLNLFAISGPYESFKNLKDQLKLPQYQQATFPFITD